MSCTLRTFIVVLTVTMATSVSAVTASRFTKVATINISESASTGGWEFNVGGGVGMGDMFYLPVQGSTKIRAVNVTSQQVVYTIEKQHGGLATCLSQGAGVQLLPTVDGHLLVRYMRVSSNGFPSFCPDVTMYDPSGTIMYSKNLTLPSVGHVFPQPLSLSDFAMVDDSFYFRTNQAGSPLAISRLNVITGVVTNVMFPQNPYEGQGSCANNCGDSNFGIQGGSYGNGHTVAFMFTQSCQCDGNGASGRFVLFDVHTESVLLTVHNIENHGRYIGASGGRYFYLNDLTQGRQVNRKEIRVYNATGAASGEKEFSVDIGTTNFGCYSHFPPAVSADGSVLSFPSSFHSSSSCAFVQFDTSTSTVINQTKADRLSADASGTAWFPGGRDGGYLALMSIVFGSGSSYTQPYNVWRYPGGQPIVDVNNTSYVTGGATLSTLHQSGLVLCLSENSGHIEIRSVTSPEAARLKISCPGGCSESSFSRALFQDRNIWVVVNMTNLEVFEF